MRSVITAILVLSLAASGSAASITKSSLKHNVAINETIMNGAGSVSALGLSFSTSLEANLSPEEVGGFSADTVINGSFPLGPKTSFKLTEDPNYHAGSTSVKIADTVYFNDIAWKRSISMAWTGGKLKLVAKITAKPTLNNFASVEWKNLVQSQSKASYGSDVRVSIIADNLGVDFLDASTFVRSSYKASGGAKPSSSGSVKVSSKMGISGNQIPI